MTGLANQWRACHRWHATQYFGHVHEIHYALRKMCEVGI